MLYPTELRAQRGEINGVKVSAQARLHEVLFQLLLNRDSIYWNALSPLWTPFGCMTLSVKRNIAKLQRILCSAAQQKFPGKIH